MSTEGWIAVAALAAMLGVWAFDKLALKIRKGIYWTIVVVSALIFVGSGVAAAVRFETGGTAAAVTAPPSERTKGQGGAGVVDDAYGSKVSSGISSQPQQNQLPSSDQAADATSQPNITRPTVDTIVAPNRAPDFDGILSDRDPLPLGEVEGTGEERFIGCAYRKAGVIDPYKQVIFGYLLGGFQPSGGAVPVGMCRKFAILASMELSAELQTTRRGDRVEVKAWHLNPGE